MSHLSIGSIVLLLHVIITSGLSQNHSQNGNWNELEPRLKYIQRLHDSIHGSDRQLINGELYFPHQQGAVNHPFYEQEGWLEGTIYISENEYPNCLIRYDLFLDQLLYLHISEGANILALNRGIVHGFVINNSKFKFIDNLIPAKGKRLKSGYYQEIYNGNVTLYTKWSKNRIKNDGHRKDEFQLNRELFIIKEAQSYKIKNDRQLISALEPHSKMIKSYMKQNNIHIITSSPEEIGAVVSYYENIVKGN